MSVGTIYGPAKNGRANKVHVTAKLCGLTLDHRDDYVLGVTSKDPEYLAKFPLGQVPSFESKDGLLLTESNAIAYYLAGLQDGTPLLGTNFNERAKIMQYIFFSETQIVPPACTLIYPYFGFMHYSEQTEKEAYTLLDKALDYLEKELDGKNYLLGEKITLADIVLAENLLMLFAKVFDQPYRDRLPNITKFFKNYRAISEVREVTGDIELADKPFKVEVKN